MNNFVQDFKRRVLKKEIRIAVVGLGYVGLPLALEFAKKGFRVIGIDLDRDRIRHIRKYESYITDVPPQELRKVVSSARFSASGDFSLLSTCQVIIICVPTPLKRRYIPNISYITQAVKSIARHLPEKSLVILESTTYPGTTNDIILPLLEQGGLKHGRDFFLCFSPERIDPGNKTFSVRRIPKVIGGINRESTELGRLVYERIIDKVVPVSSARVAETTKLLENTFRLVNIGLIDEMAMMAHKMGIDIWEVIEAAKTKPFGFMPFYPGPGVGGHCIPKDPLYLYWKAKHFGFHSRFIKLASDVISDMPEYVVERVAQILKQKRINITKSTVLVIGASYKKDVKDLRKSPSVDIIEALQKRRAKVSYYDPLIPYLKLNTVNLRSTELSKAVLARFDCVIIATDHTELDYDFILKNAQLIFDTRNVYHRIVSNKLIRL